jgi:putative oxidoreductase
MNVQSDPSRAAVPLRVVIAASFLFHGLAKFGAGHAGFVGMLDGIGVPAPEVMAWVTAITEVVGGAMVLLGLRVRLAVVPLAVVMVVAIVTVHLPNGFSFINRTGMSEAGPTFGMPGWETGLLILGALGALFLTGSGPLSIDKAQQRD